MFSIVQFEEGLDVIPTTWLNKDKMVSKWPPFSLKDSSKITKAKKKLSVPTEQWYECCVLEVIKTADTYEDAYEKLKYIDEISDVSDMDKMRGTRHERHNKYRSETDSDNEQSQPLKRSKSDIPYPQQPSTLLGTAEAVSQSTKSKVKIIENKRVKFPKRLIVDKKDQMEERESSIKESVSIEKQALSDSDNDEYNETDVCKNESKSGQSSPHDLSNLFIAKSRCRKIMGKPEPIKDITEEFYRRSFINKSELQDKMLYKINNIELQNKTIMARLTTVERNSHVKQSESQLICNEELSNKFPIKTFENLMDLENILNTKTFFNQVIQYFVTKGGYNSHNLIWNIMRTCITNTVAVEFSYKGQKGKKKFYCTKLNACIHKAVQFTYPSVTDAEIISSISKWLDGSKTRLLKESLQIHTSTVTLNMEFDDSDNNNNNETDSLFEA